MPHFQKCLNSTQKMVSSYEMKLHNW